MTYRFVVFDLDGTLLDPQRRVRPRSLQVLRRLMRRGVGVALATGRPLRSALPYAEAVDVTGPLVCFNGALVWDLRAKTLIASRHLRREVAIAAAALARQHGVHANVYLDEEIYIEEHTETSRASAVKDGIEQLPVGPLAPWLSAREEVPVKILFIGEPAALAPLAADIREACGEVVLVRSEPDYLELLPDGVNKATGLEALCAHAGIDPGHVVAFGDNLNDLELVERAGLGVAMGNGHPTLKERADRVIGANDTDAIADLLEETFAALLVSAPDDDTLVS